MSEVKLTHEEFAIQAIKKLRKGNYKGIHARYSGFNAAFRSYFEEDPIKATAALIAEGKIESKMVKGGPMFYLVGEKPPDQDVLQQIIGGA